MNSKNQDRGALIDQMLEARSVQDGEAAGKAAEDWFKETPDVVRVLAASERLGKMGMRARYPERGSNGLSLSVFVVVFTLAALAAGALTDSFYVVLAAGVLVALLLTASVWELLRDRSADAAGSDVERQRAC